ncbi:hypothetical protein GH733_015701 [Mirounga leonina]|nr:hypothetical protein GH733_015701 [Mirounga leonina]
MVCSSKLVLYHQSHRKETTVVMSRQSTRSLARAILLTPRSLRLDMKFKPNLGFPNLFYFIDGETRKEKVKIQLDILESRVMGFLPGYFEEQSGCLTPFPLCLGKFTWFSREELTCVIFLISGVSDQNNV